MGEPFEHDRPRGWIRKFAEAFRGIRIGVRGQSSFLIHLPTACLVLVGAAWFQLSLGSWSLLILCIGLVISAELFNSAIEVLAKRVTEEEDPLIADCLHIASGAVLVTSLAATVVGALVFLFER